MIEYLNKAGLNHFWDNIKGEIGNASDAQVDDWLDRHPEATTTVQDGAITTAKLANGAVDTAKLANDAVDTTKLADGSVTDAKLVQNGGVLENVAAIREVELSIGEMTTGKYINGSGEESADDGSKVSDYLYIGDRVTNILKLHDVFMQGSRCCALYNNSKVFTRYIYDDTDNRNATVILRPEEQYIRITARVSDTPKVYFDKIIKRDNAYVSKQNGDDSYDGTAYHPYKTIQKAIDNGHKNIFVDATSEYNGRIYLYNLSNITIQPWYYRTYNISIPDNIKIKINCNNSINSGVILNQCSNITLIGIETYNTTEYGFFFTNCENLKCFSCITHDTFMDGFKLVNVDGIFENCIAYNIGDSTLTHADGFNIHGYGTTIFRNCIAHDCLDDGISHHDACNGFIYGGEYYNCGKGGVASPTHGSQINVYNVRSHHNAYGLYTALEEGKTQKDSIISNCLFHDNFNAGILANGYRLICFNNVLRNNTRATQTLNNGIYIVYESNQ